jgi:hypothetical protein
MRSLLLSSECEGVRLGGLIIGVSRGENSFERGDDGRVELSLDSLGNPDARHTTRHRIAVRPVGCHRVVGVCDSNDP